MSSNDTTIDHETMIVFRASAMERLDKIVGSIGEKKSKNDLANLGQLISCTRELLAVLEQSAKLLASYLENQQDQND